MSNLLELLCDGVYAHSSADDVALLLSGGIDSTSVGIALTASGKRVRAYTFGIDGYSSTDLPKAVSIALHFGWPLKVIHVPRDCAASDFLRLAEEHRARRKVQFEVTFPLLHIMPQIEEREVWTGWNADEHYGNTRRVILEQTAMIRAGVSSAERKQRFDEYRAGRFANELADPNSGDTWWFAHRLAARLGKKLFDPYLEGAVADYLRNYDHDELSPPQKPIVRRALEPFLRGMEGNAFTTGVRLQKGGQVDRLFETLLDDPAINRFEPKYKTVSALCQRWGREVAAMHASEASTIQSDRGQTDRYTPYYMSDVREATGAKGFTVVSMFAGGGGSSVGYRLAGGKILAANEFVPEAARTYGINFPDCIVDRRDIRAILGKGIPSMLSPLNLEPGELDLLDGSPPCSEFSVAGGGMSDDGLLKAYSDVKQRDIADLPFEFVRLAVEMKPKVVVMENVPALAHRRSKPHLDAIIRALRGGHTDDRLYFVNWTTLFASDFGVPQKRQRLFIVAVRRDVGEAVGIESDEAVLSIYPKPTSSPTTIRSALDGLEQSPEDIFPWTRAAMTTPLGVWIRRLPKNPPKITRPQHVDPDEKNNFTLQRTSLDLPSPTLVVFGQQPDGRTGALHPSFDRKFTIPELKRLTSLPDDFKLTGTLAQAAERICRMVPPLLTKALAESIYERVLRPYKETQK